VLGAEHQLTQNSRVYGEYQLDGGISAEINRAVMGLSHVFHLFEGMMLGAGLEYAKFLDPAMGNTSRTVGRVSVQYTALRNFKASGRYELRYDDADPRSTMTGDRIQFVTTNNLAWQITNDLSFFSNFNYALTHNYFLNQNAGGSEAELLELNVGFAMRPVRYDWLNLLFKYTMRKELRPYLLNDNRNERSTSEVISLATIFELPLRLEIVEQFAVKFRQEQVDGLQPASTATILWINRINFKLIKNFGLGVEYRFLWMWMGSAGEAFALATFDHGFLLEATYNVHRFVHIGLGYNFSRFSDDLFAEPHRDYSGFFLRVVGKY
jgi:hypothetical protein